MPIIPDNYDAILTLEEYKLAENIADADTSRDDQIEQAIGQVTQAIRRVTDRDFGSEIVTTTRSFPYHGGGIVSIDDCSTITAVTLDGRPLAYDTDYRPEPWNEPVFFYLDLYTEPVTSRNREMDFAINLNTTRRNPNRPPQVAVTASFGWPTIPEDIKLAAIEMVRVSVKGADEELTSESIAEYSYTNVAEYSPGARWPSRAMDILATYRRPNM